MAGPASNGEVKPVPLLGEPASCEPHEYFGAMVKWMEEGGEINRSHVLEALELAAELLNPQKRIGRDCKFLNRLARDIHFWATCKGFFKPPVNLGEQIAFIHSELSEALEVARVDEKAMSEKVAGIPALGEEFADVIIRVLDTSNYLGLDIGECVEKKMLHNWTRPHKHGKKF